MKAVDFFCGAGGVTCGLMQANINVLGGVDIDPSVKETYEWNNQGAAFFEADISRLSFDDLAEKFNLSIGDDELIFVGCSPCQYYTGMQTDKGKSAKGRMLLVDFQRFVEYFKPGYIIVENVPGLESKKESPLQEFKSFLVQEGYYYDDKVINAAHYDVPQSRKRYLLLANRVGQPIKIPAGNKEVMQTVRDAIGDTQVFPEIEAGHRDFSDFRHAASGLEEINLKRLSKTPKDGGTRMAWKDDPELQLNCYQGKDKLFTDVYGRMYWDRPSPTITTKFHSVTNGRFAHPEQNRAISIREGATLQSFPTSYIFQTPSTGKASRMIGNAVPPTLAFSIGRELVNHHLLFRRKRISNDPNNEC